MHKYPSKFFFIVFLFSMLAASVAWAPIVPPSAMVGKFGFDWLQQPQKPHCTQVSEQDVARFKSCAYMGQEAPGSFTGTKDYYNCPVTKGKSEYVVYPSLTRCDEELRTMQANRE